MVGLKKRVQEAAFSEGTHFVGMWWESLAQGRAGGVAETENR